MGDHHHNPRYLFRHPGSASVAPHELFLQPRSDSDYGLRTKSQSPDGDDCMVRDEKGDIIQWKHKVGHKDWVEFHYPFKVYAECPDGHTETLITCDGRELLKAVPIAMPLHEDLEMRLSCMLHEANTIVEEARGTTHEKIAIQYEVEKAMAEDFDDEAIEEMMMGTFFRYFVATHETHGGVRVLLKFMHIVEYDEHDVAVSFSLKFRAAKVLVPHGPEFQTFFKHERSLGSLVLQNNIMRTCLNGAYAITAEMQERRGSSGEDGEDDDDNTPAEVTTSDEGGHNSERIQGIGSTIKKAAKSVGSSFSKAGKKVGKVASSAGKAVGKRAASVATAAGKGIRSAASSAGRGVGRAAGAIRSGASSAATRVRAAASSAVGKVRSGASSVYTRAKTAAGSAATSVKTAAGSAATRVKTAATSVKDKVKAQYTSVKDKVSTKANEVKKAVGQKFESVKTSVGNARDKVRDKYTSVKQSVRDRVGKIRGKNTTGSASSSASSSSASSGAPQDKVSAASSQGGGQQTAAGTASQGDPRAPVGSGAKHAPPQKDLPATPAQKAAAATAKDPSVFQGKNAPPTAPGKGGNVYKPPATRPGRHGDPASKPAAPAASAKADDGLAKYNAPPPSSSAGGSGSHKAPAGQAPHPPASSASPSASASGSANVQLKHSASPGSTSTAKITNADGTSHTVVAKTRADGSTKVTTTKTAADGTILSKDKQNHAAAPGSAQANKGQSGSGSKAQKEPKEKKQGTLSKLKDKVTSKGGSSGQSSSSSGSGGNSGDGGGGSGGGGGGDSGYTGGSNADLAANRPDYDRQMRDQERQDAEQDRQRDVERDVRPYEFRGNVRKDDNLAGAVVAGALTGAVVASAANANAGYYQQPPVVMAGVPPPGGLYGPPPVQSLPPGYATTANGVMAVGPDGRLYPLTPQQYAELQFYQQRQQGLVPGGAGVANAATAQQATAPDSSSSSGTVTTSSESYKPTHSVRLADDDELVGGPAANKPTAPTEVSTNRDEQPINDQLSEAAEAERRDALYKYMLAEHTSSFGKPPTKVQKEKLRARLSNARPFVIKKIFAAYVEWLTNDTGLRYA